VRNVRTHKFNGVKYNIDIDTDVEGVCDSPRGRTKRWIQIFSDLKDKRGLILLIHESLHASDWLKSEEDVDRVSTEIGNFLWRLGYRRKVR
jgi:hypothetical protein